MSGHLSPPIDPVDIRGARILVVEDEYFIADEVQRALRDAGATIVGPVSTLAGAHQALDRGEFDCAAIDLNLHGESALPIADRLASEGKSFAIATGYGMDSVPERLRHVPRIEKPFDHSAFMQLVGQLHCIA